MIAKSLCLLPCDGAFIYKVDLYLDKVDLYGKNIIKDIALVAMNVKRSKGKRPYQGALQAIKKNVCEKHGVTYPEAKAAFYAFIDKHKAIENYICSDFGIKAMYYDSLIIEDCLHKLLVQQNIMVLPVHDELLCPADKADIVKQQMINSYRKVIKDALVQKKKWNKKDPLPEVIMPAIKQGKKRA